MNPRRLLLLALLMLASVASADVIFTDTTFNLADYSLYSYTTDPSVVFLSPTRCEGCGTPNTMSLAAQFDLAPGMLDRWSYAALINNTFAYDPQTQGAIGNLTVSGIKELTTSINVLGGKAFPIRILQDGKIYTMAIVDGNWQGTSSGFVSFFQSGLTADMFTEFDYLTGTVGTGHPDFAGSVLYFGVGERTGWFSPAAVVVTNNWQNVTFDIAPVPEPTSMVLLGSGLLGGVLRRKLRR